MQTLTLNQAAKRSGVSRWTVARALKAGDLQGILDNRQRWRVDAEALDAWAAKQPPVPSAEQRTELHPEQHRAALEPHGAAPVQASAYETVELRAEVRSLREQLDQERQDRARDREDLERERKERERDREDREQERQAAQATAEDLRKRLDQETEERRALQRQLAPPAPERPKEAVVEDLRKRLEEMEAWIAALTAPEKPQKGRNGTARDVEPSRSPWGLLARLRGR